MGLAVLALGAASLGLGVTRVEAAFALLGAAFLAVLAYCFLAVFVTGLVYRRRVRDLRVEADPGLVTRGASIRLRPRSLHAFAFRLPAVILRGDLRLATRDGRKLICRFDPDRAAGIAFPVPERGAYYAPRDFLHLADAPGFFHLVLSATGGDEPRVLATPDESAGPLDLPLRAGGTERRPENEQTRRRADDLTDHRPYTPGDDPRRINWKIYSHGPSGELFVREGNPEPPPHARLALLLDTEADPALFSPEEARRAVDALCAQALRAARDLLRKDVDIVIGYTGGELWDANAADAARQAGAARQADAMRQADAARPLSFPAALPLDSGEQLPEVPRDRSALVLALPRTRAGALERFLARRRDTDVLMLDPRGGPRPGRRHPGR